MEKPRLFIGCSTENMEIAAAIQQGLDYEVEPSIWDQGAFRASEYPLESLENALDVSDFAAFVFVPDDETTMRGEQSSTVRDNVIFELGLAIGRVGRKRTFIVMPRGVDFHLPTDLAGLTPLKYNPSRSDANIRAAVGPACTELKQAIASQGLRVRPNISTMAEEPELSSDEVDAENEADWVAGFLTPSDDWSFERLKGAWRISISWEKPEQEQVLKAYFMAGSFSSNEENVAEWESIGDYQRLRLGQHNSISGLRDRARTYPDNIRLQRLLAEALAHYGDHQAALETLEEAARRTNALPILEEVLAEAAGQAKAAGTKIDIPAYRGMLFDAIDAPTSNDDDIAFLSALRRLSAHAEYTWIKLALDEVLLRRQPDNTSLRFELAHGYGEVGRNELALVHYEGIPVPQRSAGAWNNLGVAYSNLLSPGLAVESYRVASEKGATVADGNLAKKLIHAGFFKEAREIAERAVASQDHDESVDKLMPSLQEAAQKEGKAAELARTTARLQQTHMRLLGDAATKRDLVEAVGRWKSPDGVVEITANETDQELAYTGKGTITRETGGNALGLVGLARGTQTLEANYQLRRLGNAYEGIVSRSPLDGSAVSLLGLGMYTRSVTMILSDDGNTLTYKEDGRDEGEVIWRRDLGVLLTP